ncbi:PREDICTED: NADH dehydrogenase [ubiquinone] 1 beta subcomplex subunit 7-like [Priapulus caudatus]|uniref:NADH dehydrogenase [ubiquinone] 1 beta subcomplex subunit 7 n=1 Tax=Priapulus caudatus TaxID=37621 RepID=A0ABM1DQU5_PRICU|nr:PREDICTED: NADH dehydrogenase [ubiquinone] 1 beta subcomplex subunit 7-like [Priapulus caudatus]
MGVATSSYNAYFKEQDVTPDNTKQSTFDPMLGFPNGRKERVMIATQEEMEASNILLEQRDYCAHLLIDWKRCKHDNFPLAYKCKHEGHVYELCQFDDYVLRMKEYERERRLLKRANRIQAKDSSESLEE